MVLPVNSLSGQTYTTFPGSRLLFPTLCKPTALGVDPKTVRRYISQGRLKVVRVGPRLIRIERESLDSLGKPLGGAQ